MHVYSYIDSVIISEWEVEQSKLIFKTMLSLKTIERYKTRSNSLYTFFVVIAWRIALKTLKAC